MSDIVPFGKHKGKPVEALLDDREYLEWLLSQGWFQQRYGNLYQIVINNGQEPAETPEHNAMQIKFLDEEYRLKFAYAVKGAHLFTLCDAAEIRQRMNKIESSLSVWQTVSWYGLSPIPNKSGVHFRDYKERSGTNLAKTAQLIVFPSPIFEPTSGGDVQFRVETGIEWATSESCDSFRWPLTHKDFTFRVEIKPAIGDDYPAVLRQIQRNKSGCLLIRAYNGVGATQEQFVRFFDSQGIKVVFEANVDAAILPPFDRELAI